MQTVSIQLKIDGDNVRPETVALKDLFEILEALEGAILAVAGTVPTGTTPPLALITVKDGSDELGLALDERLVPAWSRISECRKHNTLHELPKEACKNLYKISAVTANNKWSVDVTSKSKLNVVPFHVSHLSPIEEIPQKTVSGQSTIYGRCVTVGGRKPKVWLEVTESNSPLAIRITESMAREISGRLYELVGLEGSATWNSVDLSLVSFRATRLVKYKPLPIPEAFKALADSHGEVWEGIDVEKYVHNIRYGDE